MHGSEASQLRACERIHGRERRETTKVVLPTAAGELMPVQHHELLETASDRVQDEPPRCLHWHRVYDVELMVRFNVHDTKAGRDLRYRVATSASVFTPDSIPKSSL